MSKILFTADLHFGHTNILKHQPNRPFASESDTRLHDEWLMDLWKSSVDKKDMLYILGDLTFLKSDEALRLLEKLPGRKYMILGNHDGSIKSYSNYFMRFEQMLDVTIKPTLCPELPVDVMLTMCHYPMVTWNHKPYGSIMLHGHCHGKLDEYNAASPDLRFDVGIDGQLSAKYGGFIPMEAIYAEAMAKTGGVSTHEYAKNSYESAKK